MVAPSEFMATPITEVGGFQIQESSDAAAAAAAAAASLAPELPTEISGIAVLSVASTTNEHIPISTASFSCESAIAALDFASGILQCL